MADKKNVVWITGASSGIGKALAVEFARNNIFVIGTARRLELLNEIKKELADYGKNFEPHQLDITDKAAIGLFHKNILSDYNVGCLINNAGITSFKLAQENSINEIDDIINTNLLGSIYTIKSVLPKMIEQGGGTIINILSIVTKKVFTHSSAYAASKNGLMAYTNVLREEVRKHKIKVINIIPGATETPMWSQETRKENSERMMSTGDIARLLVWVYLQKENMISEEIVVRPIEGDL